MPRLLRPVLATTLWLALLATGCDRHQETSAPTPEPEAGGESTQMSPSAQPELVAMLLEDRDRPRDPSDGGGRAWLEGDASATARTPGRWTVLYEAGPLGVAEGGGIYFMTSPFWGWSTPQTRAPEVHGYTEVTTDAAGVLLEPLTVDAQLLLVTIRGRALAAGERIRFVFGAGPAQAGPDRFGERAERFWLSVDGDGDGTRRLVEGSPRIDVAPGEPARLVLTLQSTARPGEPVRLAAAVLDAEGSAGVRFAGEVTLELEALRGPDRIAFSEGDGAATHVSLEAPAVPGVYRVRGRAGELRAESNPLVVDDGPRILWGDLHGHSNLSDGTGTPEDWFRYARDVAALDVAALTDHDHWGVRFLDERPDLWEQIQSQVKGFHAPGRFVALLGYEWTSWIHGHRHVLYFGDRGQVYSSLDESTDDPRELWAALDGQPALTFAHHSAGGPVATNWNIPPDPRFEPVTEIVSVHGSSEAPDAANAIYSGIPGNYVRDVLDRGYTLGFVGSGDGHDGHPGLTHLASPSGGLAAILAPEATRDGVLEALRSRRSYATNGPRIVLRAQLAGHPMGSSLGVETLRGEVVLRVSVAAPGELVRLELVRSGRIVGSWAGEGRRELGLDVPLQDLAAGDYLYLRATQVGGGAAWSSPFFIE